MTSRIKREAVSHKGLGGKEGNFGRKGLVEGLTMRYTAGQMMNGMGLGDPMLEEGLEGRTQTVS
jgi:hypothetical protein